MIFFFFQAEDGIRDLTVTGVQTCALPIYFRAGRAIAGEREAGPGLHVKTGVLIDGERRIPIGGDSQADGAEETEVARGQPSRIQEGPAQADVTIDLTF